MQPCDPFRHVVRSNAQPGWYVARVQFEQMPKSSFPERRQNGQTCDATNHGRLRQPGPPPARQAENPRMGHGVRAMEMETGGMGDRVPVKPTSATPPSLPSPWSLAALLSRCWGATHTSPSALPTNGVGDPATRQLSSPGSTPPWPTNRPFCSEFRAAHLK